MQNGKTLLVLASEGGNETICGWLLDAGADVNAADEVRVSSRCAFVGGNRAGRGERSQTQLMQVYALQTRWNVRLVIVHCV